MGWIQQIWKYLTFQDETEFQKNRYTAEGPPKSEQNDESTDQEEQTDQKQSFRWYHHTIAIVWGLLGGLSSGMDTMAGLIGALIGSLAAAYVMVYIISVIGRSFIKLLRFCSPFHTDP